MKDMESGAEKEDSGEEMGMGGFCGEEEVRSP